jgi:DNA-binding CsgD family transcriptional regulator
MARSTGDLIAELRSAHNLVASRYYAGDLADAAKVCDAAIERARATGVLWMGYGVGTLIFRQLIRYVSGDLTPAPALADWVPDSTTSVLAVLELYPAAARGDSDVVERGRAVKADWQQDPMMALISGGCTIDALTWGGQQQAAIELTLQVIDFLNNVWNDYFLGGIWLSALGLTALADRAEQTRLVGGDTSADESLGRKLIDRAVETAQRGRPRGGRLGPEGRGWLARARAEYGRLTAHDDPELWQQAITEFGYGYRYEVARCRWRRAAALAGTGDTVGARAEATAALAEAEELGARPLAEATRQLGRRARLDLPGVRQPLGLLTERENEVLRLVATGLTNRQVGERLFISSKTVSVHMSNVLAKLGASSRAEAVSVAHQRGLLEAEPAGHG